jgi:hypothetical protein
MPCTGDFVRRSMEVKRGRSLNLEIPPMLSFLLGLAALVVVTPVTDLAARREGYDELKAGTRPGA